MAGSLLLAMALLHIANAFISSIPLTLSGLYGWLVLIWLLYKLPAQQFIQFFILAGVGSLLLIIGYARGATISITELLTQNNALLVMLYGVSFLRLSALPKADIKQQQGKRSLLGNFFGIQSLGAVINLSILVLVGEYFKSHQLLKRLQITVMSRAFAIAAFWSPFFASMGVALTYAPHASLLGVLSLGLGVALIASLISLVEFKYLAGNSLNTFQGYPLKLNSLALPFSLALSIILLHYLAPQLPILTLVALLAMLFSAALLVVKRLPVKERFAEHVQAAPLRMARELALFLGAGVLTIGLKVLLSTFPNVALFTQFTGLEASLSLGLAIIVSLMGIHPLISIALIGPMATPLVADPNILGLLFLSIWSLGVVASPLSGMNVMMRGQLGIAGKDLLRWHIGYVIVMWVLLSVLFTWLLG
ncbi:MAG: hypothetical protein WAQ53_14660 [Thiofilum sp.]|uniref:hypothetical protein n=1 Tax=Thiofilum sp. TaxID=2212733 RepID=UPI0025D2F024|nr:hypothetical protein [Thiofilum sp.]MBK8453544.1 hypothetical protein [Thiofilum sp.]